MNVEVKILTTENHLDKLQFGNRVYNLLETAYKDCGGINLASGFKNIEDMINSIPVWRLSFVNNELISVMLFKVKSNKLKMVAYAPLLEIDPALRKSDLEFMLNNSYAELSGKLLSITLKEINNNWQNFVSKNPENIINRKLIPLNVYLENGMLPSNSEGMYWKLKNDYPQILEYCYLRKIGNEFKLKVLIEPIN
jgi:hypothetical protein